MLTSHPAVRFVGFTGSTEVGKLLMRQAASTVKKVGLELGGNAPFIVFDDADLDAAVEGAIVAKFRNMGQTCVCANRSMRTDGIYDDFVERLARKSEDLKVGNGVEVGVEQGPLINVGRGREGGAPHRRRGRARRARGRRRQAPRARPHLLRADRPRRRHDEMLVTREETFGPVAPVYRFKDEAEVVPQANATPFGLAAYFYARDLGRVFRVAEALEYGMVGVNTGAISTEAPFGGVKELGIGREGSRTASRSSRRSNICCSPGCRTDDARPGQTRSKSPFHCSRAARRAWLVSDRRRRHHGDFHRRRERTRRYRQLLQFGFARSASCSVQSWPQREFLKGLAGMPPIRGQCAWRKSEPAVDALRQGDDRQMGRRRSVRRRATNAPLLRDALVHFECEMWAQYDGGDQ